MFVCADDMEAGGCSRMDPQVFLRKTRMKNNAEITHYAIRNKRVD